MSSRNGWGAVRKLPSKRYQASYVAPDGNRYTGRDTFTTKTEANGWLASVRTEIQDGCWVCPTLNEVESVSMKFEDYAGRHIQIQTNRKGELLRESTKSVYHRQLRTHLGGFLALEVKEISKPMVEEWYAKEIATGKLSSASKAYKLLAAVMKRAVSDGILPASPCSIRGAHQATTGKVVDSPTIDEVAAIASTINPRYKVLVLLAAYGGFRFGEITELRRKDVRAVENDGVVSYVISVTRAVTLVGSEFVVDKPKSAKSIREVNIAASMTQVINDHLFGSVEAGQDALLFPSARGKHLRHDVFMNSWRPALLKVGITREGITPHSLRHFAGTHYHLAGATIPELMEWLGDSSISVIQRYLHTTDRASTIANKMAVSIHF
jgi:integrase